MVGVRYLKKDRRIMEPSGFKFVGKDCLVPSYVKVGLINFTNKHYPDALCSVEFFDSPIKNYQGEELNSGERILISRMGGAGDIIMIAPSIQKLKTLYPGISVDICTTKKMFSLVKSIPAFDKVVTFPLVDFAKYDYLIEYGTIIEDATRDARSIPGIDLFAKATSVELGADEKLMRFGVKSQKKITKLLKDTDDKIVVLQFRPSNVNRAFSVGKMAQVVKALSELGGIQVFVVGGDPRECIFQWRDENSNKPHPKIHKLFGDLSWEETIDLVGRADLCIGSDSSLVHIAGMMGVPCIGIFGPIPHELRTKYYPSVCAIQAERECVPCFSHGSSACSFLTQRIVDFEKKHKEAPPWVASPCWDSIEVNTIVQKSKQLLEEE